ncbi:MAG: sigma-70 family RNA polymerase sigma factor [Planctomycetes bacterium]|nr:sigma-70 family RNA polymerase sigma factor [Planctomycetota bacterium]
MSADTHESVTRLLRAAADGEPEAAKDLLPLVYEELRTLARARLRRQAPGQTLQPTALVHEAYLRLVGNDDPGWDGRGHFFAAAARSMRDILVEHARRKMAQKRGGGRRRIAADQAEPVFEPPSEDVLAVDEAVRQLERDDPRKGQIVNLRYFARLTTAETASALGVSVGTVEREWRYIRAWLQRELAERPGS